MQIDFVNLNQTDLENLKTIPIKIIPEKGEGTFIVPYKIVFRYRHNTTPYDIENTSFRIICNELEIVTSLSTDILSSSEDKFQVYPFLNSNILDVESCNNYSINIHNIGISELSLGDGSLDIFTYYDIYDIN